MRENYTEFKSEKIFLLDGYFTYRNGVHVSG